MSKISKADWVRLASGVGQTIGAGFIVGFGGSPQGAAALNKVVGAGTEAAIQAGGLEEPVLPSRDTSSLPSGFSSQKPTNTGIVPPIQSPPIVAELPSASPTVLPSANPTVLPSSVR